MRLLGSTIARLHSLVVQRSLHEQSRTTQLRLCLPHLSDLQQLAAAALGTHTIRSSNSWGTQLPACGSVRSMAGRTHKLSLKKANNKASWMAVQPYLQQEQQQQSDQLQQRRAQVIQSAIPALPVLEEPILYQRIGKITGPYRVGPQPCFAVIETGGCQWKVTADDVIYHNKIPGAQVNDVLEFNKVLLLGTREETTIGRPFVPGASVVAAVEETFKDAKVYVFKKKKRKRYSKLQGHRSHITALRILEVRQPAAAAAAVTQPDAAAALAGLTNVAAIGPNALAALRAASRSQQQLQYPKQPAPNSSSRPQAAAEPLQEQAAAAAADGGMEDVDAAVAAAAAEEDQPQVWQKVPRRAAGAGRQHGPPAVLTAVPKPEPRAKAAQQ